MEELKRIEIPNRDYLLSDFKRVPRKVKKRTKITIPPAPIIKNGREIMVNYFGFSEKNLL